eukprot:scaffold16861_cov101-Isochrysis_galbana.AAC.1
MLRRSVALRIGSEMAAPSHASEPEHLGRGKGVCAFTLAPAKVAKEVPVFQKRKEGPSFCSTAQGTVNEVGWGPTLNPPTDAMVRDSRGMMASSEL